MNLDKLIKERGGIKLDIGCGDGKTGDDWVGIDVRPLPGVDIIQDFNNHPWALPDECVITAMCRHVLEHIPKVFMERDSKTGDLLTRFPLIEFMDEIWRIMKPDGQLAIIVPHGQSPAYMQDPTHVSQINETLFMYFDPIAGTGELYTVWRPKPWKIRSIDYSPAGWIEAVLIKRRMDKSYEGR